MTPAGYTDKPRSERARLSFEIGRLTALAWADPGDDELREAVVEAEALLAAYDRVHDDVRNGGAS